MRNVVDDSQSYRIYAFQAGSSLPVEQVLHTISFCKVSKDSTILGIKEDCLTDINALPTPIFHRSSLQKGYKIMMKRISILTLIVFSTLALAALAPFHASASVTAQDATVVPTIVVPTVVVTTGSTAIVVPVPVTGPSGTPLSTLVIIGLLIILGFAIIVGGMAMSRRPVDEDVPPDHHHH